MFHDFTGEEPPSFIPITAAIGAAVVLIGVVLVVVIIVLLR